MGDTVLIETTADEVVSIVTVGPQGPSGAEAATLTTTGDLLYRAALANDRLPIGSEGQVLKVASGLPAWGNESGSVTSVAGRTGDVTLAVADVANAVSDSDARLTDARTPTSHAASHATGGSDAIAPSDIGAQSIFVTEDLGTITADVTLTAARAKIYTVTANASGLAINLPTTNIQTGDVVQIRFTSFTGQTLAVKRDGSFYGNSLQNGQQATYIAASTAANSWEEAANNRHAHGSITNEGRIGTVSGLPLRTSSGGLIAVGAFGTAAGEFAAGDHTHTQLHDRSHAITSTSDHTATAHRLFYSSDTGAVTELAFGDSGKVLQSNGATSAPTWETPSGGVSAIGTSAADILSVSGSDIVADDAGADRIVFWDDSESKLAYLEAGSGLSISGTTITATASGGSKTYAVFTPDNNQPPASNYATLDTRNSVACLDFDDATDESAVFVGLIPEGASLGSGLKIRLHWAATTATSGDVRWDVQLERMTTDLDSDSFDTVASATATTNGTSGILTVTEITLTTIDSVTSGDGFRLKVTRDANNGADTMSGDCELFICEVRSAA
jgi:hypothetical protein